MRFMFDFEGFHEARKDQMQRHSKLKALLTHRRQINNYDSLLLYACEVSVDDEPSFNETIRQKARKCRRRKLKYSVLSSEMFFKFL